VKNSVLIIIFSASSLIVSSQVSQKVDSLQKSDTIFYPDNPDPNVRIEYETMPEFPGGDDSLIAFVQRQLKYPRTLIKDSIEGRIIIKFSVNGDGVAGEVGFIKGLHRDIEKECIEMIKRLPRFKPGTMLTKSRKGWYWRPATVWYTLPVYFTPTYKNPYNYKVVITP
jgi:hypothetical protein